MANTPLIRMGIDIGFGDVKVVSGRINGNGRYETEKFKFPYTVARIKNKTITGLDDAQAKYEFKKRKYLVGSDTLASVNIKPLLHTNIPDCASIVPVIPKN